MRPFMVMYMTSSALLLGLSGGRAQDRSNPARISDAERAAVKAVQAVGGQVGLNNGTVTGVDFRSAGIGLTDDYLKKMLRDLRELKNLQYLSFVGCAQVTDVGLKAVLKEHQNLHNLRTLFIGGTGVTDAAMKEVNQLRGLEQLGLSNTQVTDAGLRDLKELKGLRSLIIVNTKATRKGVNDLKKVLPNLQAMLRPAPALRQGRLSPHKTIRASIDGDELMVQYGRPYAKDPISGKVRKIWGGLVPYGSAWRTGADEATIFRTTLPIVVDGTTIPAGAYTLYTVPEEEGPSKLVFSKKVGQWGEPVNQNSDFARVDMKKEPLDKDVNQFTIAIEKTEKGGVLKLMWEKTQFSVPFTVKKK